MNVVCGVKALWAVSKSWKLLHKYQSIFQKKWGFTIHRCNTGFQDSCYISISYFCVFLCQKPMQNVCSLYCLIVKHSLSSSVPVKPVRSAKLLFSIFCIMLCCCHHMFIIFREWNGEGGEKQKNIQPPPCPPLPRTLFRGAKPWRNWRRQEEMHIFIHARLLSRGKRSQMGGEAPFYHKHAVHRV